MTDLAIKISSSKKLENDKVRLGLWVYIMCDLVMFSTLFATFLILRPATAGGVAGRDIIDLSFVFLQTVLLLASSVTVGIAYLAVGFNKVKLFRVMLAMTFLLGLGFLAMEAYEFAELIGMGATWSSSAFLSSFFTLVGAHGVHIIIGLIWAAALFVTSFQKKLSANFVRKTGLFSMFWHFLDIVWIFIFTIVYLMGVM